MIKQLEQYRSKFYKKNILLQHWQKWILPSIIPFLITIIAVSGWNNPYPSQRRKAFFIDGIKGLQYFGWNQFFISTLIFILFGFIIFLLIYFYQKDRKMIVAIAIDQGQDKITISTKDLLNIIRHMSINIKHLSIIRSKGADGISIEKEVEQEFEYYLFKDRDFIVGRLYKNHYTWEDPSTVQEIIDKIKKIKATN